jgi:hypothetical protein
MRPDADETHVAIVGLTAHEAEARLEQFGPKRTFRRCGPPFASRFNLLRRDSSRIVGKPEVIQKRGYRTNEVLLHISANRTSGPEQLPDAPSLGHNRQSVRNGHITDSTTVSGLSIGIG